MNTELINKVIETLRKGTDAPDDLGFSMDYVYLDTTALNNAVHAYRPGTQAPLIAPRDCGTVACIAGWVNVLDGATSTDAWSMDEAAFRLGIPTEVADRLFMPDNVSYDEVRPADAAEALENILAGATTNDEIWKHMLPDTDYDDVRHPDECFDD